ncbi:MAG: hypothetical protein ACTTH5_05850 [Wolinella sp.]
MAVCQRDSYTRMLFCISNSTSEYAAMLNAILTKQLLASAIFTLVIAVLLLYVVKYFLRPLSLSSLRCWDSSPISITKEAMQTRSI